MKKILVLLTMTLALLFGCDQITDDVSTNNNNGENNNIGNQNGGNTGGGDNEDDKPANPQTLTLQQIINDTNAGEEIDLSKYKDVTDYSATVNKALTIKNGSLNNAKLIVTAENVKLEKLEKVSVSTSSRLTINDSKLSDLLIGANSETSRSGTLSTEMSLAMASITGCEIENVELIGFNSQLNITDVKTKINDIITSTKAKIILEAGSYTGMKDPTVTNDGELTRIDMTKGNKPMTLSIYSYPEKMEYNIDDEIDCSDLIVMGVYAASSGEIFKSGGWKGEAVEAVIKWENEDDYDVIYNFDTEGTKIVTIKSKKDECIECYFPVIVKTSSEDDENQPVMKNIVLDKVKEFRTLYYEGEILDLSCFKVVGNCDDGNKINLPFTCEPANGTLLKEIGEYKVTFFYDNKKIGEDVLISVVPAVNIDFVLGNGIEKEICSLKVPMGDKVKYPYFPEKEKYNEHIWYSKDIHGIGEDGVIVNNDMEIIGYGIAEDKECTIKFMNLDGSLAKTFSFKPNDEDTDEEGNSIRSLDKELTQIYSLTRFAYIHYKWSTDKECDLEHNGNIDMMINCPNHLLNVYHVFENYFLSSDKYEITLYPVFHTKEYIIQYRASVFSEHEYLEKGYIETENNDRYYEQLFSIKDESLILKANPFNLLYLPYSSFLGWSDTNYDNENPQSVKYQESQVLSNDDIKKLIEEIEADDSLNGILQLYSVWKS